MYLKQNLDHFLKRRGLTASGLARISDTPKQTIADWLAGASPRDLRAIKRVADALMVSVDILCFSDLKNETASEFEKRIHEINAGQFEVVLRKVKP